MEVCLPARAGGVLRETRVPRRGSVIRAMRAIRVIRAIRARRCASECSKDTAGYNDCGRKYAGSHTAIACQPAARLQRITANEVHLFKGARGTLRYSVMLRSDVKE